jgi:hypothetical protein
MHNPAQAGTTKGGLAHEQQQVRGSYSQDYMNLDDNIFGLDSEGRDLVYGTHTHPQTKTLIVPPHRLLTGPSGRNGMADHAATNQHHYEGTPMQTDNSDIDMMAQMPTPVSNNIRAAPDGSTFMSPLQVDQQGAYDRMNGVAYAHQSGSEETVPQTR